MELLESQSHGIALSAIPRIFLVEFLRLSEDLQAIVQSWVAIDVLVLVFVLYVYWLSKEDFKLHFFVSLGKEFSEGAVEGFGKVAVVAFFIAELAHVSGSFEVVDVHLYADLLCQCLQSLSKVVHNLITSFIQPLLLTFFIIFLNLGVLTFYNLRIVLNLGPVIHPHGICCIHYFFILCKVGPDDLQPKGAESVLVVFHQNDKRNSIGGFQFVADDGFGGD